MNPGVEFGIKADGVDGKTSYSPQTHAHMCTHTHIHTCTHTYTSYMHKHMHTHMHAHLVAG